ncbi:hypothetical protein Cs7R123_01740 [Catellatospora sp. TT07R-123]|uniref:hypothetical protein n=1 Tax=Catellatospora sp. TT07R-123 TaxID=2733863 RepID=UPI001B2F29F1|nr:hypothetical protein [Catellatospora sp. TT07R-123]GHJ42832.1 hypothetical protein Cs7R123_01740 [Catellatospora sp. TT07R-123]
MAGAILDKATGLLDRRFVLNVLGPSLVFWSALAVLVAQGTGWSRWGALWRGLSGLEQAYAAGGVLALVMIFGAAAGSQIVGLTRLWQGYWPSPLGRAMAGRGIRRERRRRDRLDPATHDGYQRRYYGFPPRSDEVLPTRLGNVLQAAEAYSGDEARYGADAAFFWPRLYLVLPADIRTAVDQARSRLGMFVMMASLGTAFPLLGLVPVLLLGTAWTLWAALSAAAVVTAVVAYRGSVRAGAAFGDLVRSCFDLHRRTALRQLGLAVPTTLEQERRLWRALRRQLYRRGPGEPGLEFRPDPAP